MDSFRYILTKPQLAEHRLAEPGGVEPSSSTLPISRYLHYRATLQQCVTNIHSRISAIGDCTLLVFHAIATFIDSANTAIKGVK